MKDEEIIRKQAVELHLKSIPINDIADKLFKTRQWVHKWLKRYKTGSDVWYQSLSNTPKKPISRIPEDMEKTIVSIRNNLKEQKYAQKGALNILYEFKRLNIIPPSMSTINRVIQRNGLLGKGTKREAKKKEYPDYFTNVQQMDLIGPKYLRGGCRYYILNIIAIEPHYAGVYPIPNKSSKSVMPAVCQFWIDFSMPDYLQMDNELSFRGSNRYPRSFGPLIRLALSENITPVFIPPAEPWRNGVIEKFNDNVQKYFLKTQTFSNFEQLKERAVEFMAFHNQNHRYSTTGGNTPNQMVSDSQCFKLNAIPGPNQRIQMTEGEIVFIRFIRSDCMIRILDMKFELKKELMYSYVIARIVIKNHILLIERDHIVFHVFPFLMPVD